VARPASTYSKVLEKNLNNHEVPSFLTESTESIAMMIDPGAKLLAVLDKAEEYRGLGEVYFAKYLILMVGAAGFEPTTCSTQNCRATRLRYTPIIWETTSIHA
jgi:hypothetical protein